MLISHEKMSEKENLQSCTRKLKNIYTDLYENNGATFCTCVIYVNKKTRKSSPKVGTSA